MDFFFASCVEHHTGLVIRPEILRMSELNDSSELQAYSSAVLYVVSAVTPPPEDVEVILNHFMDAIKSSTVTLWFCTQCPN